MKVKRIVYVLSIFFLIFNLLCGVSDGKIKGKAKKKDEEKSLVRKHLLSWEKKEMDLPLRNIFFPKSSGQGMSYFEATGENPDFSRETADNMKEGKMSSVLDLKYIGYISSGEKIVAVVIFEGEARAVEKGDMIFEGFSVAKISMEEMEIIGPDSKKRKYCLEGDNQ